MTEQRFALPHPLALLTACIIVAAALTWAIPTGQYDRRDDPATGRRVVVAGSYHRVPPAPVGPFGAVLAVPHGLADAAAVVFFVFLVGGAFTVVEETGALRHAVSRLVLGLGDRGTLAIPIVSLAFAAAGALENMQEEIIALVPVLLLVTRRLGFDAITAVAISIGSAAVGAAFSPINPFQVQIAQKLAVLPPLSGALFRLVVMAVALTVWISGTWRHALRTRRPVPRTDPEDGPERVASSQNHRATPETTESARSTAVLVLVLLSFVVFIYGVMQLGWDFDQMAALFLAMGIGAGLIGGLGVERTSRGFVNGFAAMAYAAMLIGFARGIYVVMDQGRIVDTIVSALASGLQHLPVVACAVAMMAAQAVIHIPVPSVSGQAVLTMPVMVPVSDVIGLSRQVVVLAYQYGAGLTELVTPTNGAMVAVAAAAGLPFGDWLRFAWRMYALLLVLGGLAIATAIAIRL